MKQAIINLINKWACRHDYILKDHYTGIAFKYYLFVCKKCGRIKRTRL